MGNYDAVINAMPGYLKVAVANAICAAYNGADKATLAGMVDEAGQAATKAKLAAYKAKCKW